MSSTLILRILEIILGIILNIFIGNIKIKYMYCMLLCIKHTIPYINAII